MIKLVILLFRATNYENKYLTSTAKLQQASKAYIFYFHTKSSPSGHPTENQHHKYHDIVNAMKQHFNTIFQFLPIKGYEANFLQARCPS